MVAVELLADTEYPAAHEVSQVEGEKPEQVWLNNLYVPAVIFN